MLTLVAVLLAQNIPTARLARAEIWFDARATIADFQGRTTAATGQLQGGAAPADARGWVEIRWRDIDTRNGTRNRHMLETVDEERFPVIRFELTRARPEVDSVMGALTLHGVTRQVAWPLTVRIGADTITVAADFPVDMREYGIKPPVRFLIARMGAVVQVHVRLVFVRSTEHGAVRSDAPLRTAPCSVLRLEKPNPGPKAPRAGGRAKWPSHSGRDPCKANLCGYSGSLRHARVRVS